MWQSLVMIGQAASKIRRWKKEEKRRSKLKQKTELPAVWRH